jgi:pimeloyl-ACP methyl ester carboxylesterase
MVQDRFIESRGLQFHYRAWSNKGTPLIFLHGLASQSHMFDKVAPLLADRFRVIALDQRGHGESAKPSSGYDFATVAQDLVALLDALKIKRAIVAGHSWGGNVALYFAAHYPERARGIVLIDGGFLDIQSNPEMTWERTAKELAPPNLIGTPVDDFKQMLRQYAGKLWKPFVEEIVLRNFEIQKDNTIRPRLSYANHMRILRALWEQRPADYYPLVRCPALILPAANEHVEEHAWSERRRALVEAAARGIEKNRVVWFHETVHDIPLQRPRKLANVITSFAVENKLIR